MLTHHPKTSFTVQILSFHVAVNIDSPHSNLKKKKNSINILLEGIYLEKQQKLGYLTHTKTLFQLSEETLITLCTREVVEKH